MPALVPINTTEEDEVMELVLSAIPPPVVNYEVELPRTFASWAAEMEWEDRLREQ